MILQESLEKIGRKANFVAPSTCYECGKVGHIKSKCLVLKMTQKLGDRTSQDNRKHRQKKANIAWEDSDSNCSSSDFDESLEEETNLCLMVGLVCSNSSANNFGDDSIDRYY